MKLIEGAALLEQKVHVDERGLLGALEESGGLPFPLERVFFIKVDDPEVERADHANTCEQYLVAIAGSLRVEVDNGSERSKVRLEDPRSGLWVRPGVLIRLQAFAPGTVLLVCASARYAAVTYFTTPQPDLIPTDGRL